MLKREDVYRLIDNERTYQDVAYNPLSVVSSGLTRGQRDTEVTPHLVLLEGYIRKANDAWVNTKNGNNLPAPEP